MVAMELIFEWDGVSFEEAKTIFTDALLLTYPDDFHPADEERLISIGYSSRQRLLLVVHIEHDTDNELLIRIISSRRATVAERETYEDTSAQCKFRA